MKDIDQKESERQSVENDQKVIVSQGDDDDGDQDDEQEKSQQKDSSMAQEHKVTDEDEEELFLESNISRVLTERTTKSVICLVLILLFILPLF